MLRIVSLVHGLYTLAMMALVFFRRDFLYNLMLPLASYFGPVSEQARTSFFGSHAPWDGFAAAAAASLIAKDLYYYVTGQPITTGTLVAEFAFLAFQALYFFFSESANSITRLLGASAAVWMVIWLVGAALTSRPVKVGKKRN